MRAVTRLTGNALRNQVRNSAWNFQDLMESKIPEYRGRPTRRDDEVEKIKSSLPSIQFLTSYEYDVLSKTRSNVVGEYRYQRDLRQKIAELVLDEAPHRLSEIHMGNPETQRIAELKALQNLSEYAGDLMEKQHQSLQRYNDFVDSNNVYLLEQPWREEARWNSLEEMDSRTRAVVRNELRNWLPSDFQQHKAADLEQIAAFSPSIRAQMLKKIDERAAAAEKEIAGLPAGEQKAYKELLQADVAASKRFIDPTLDITTSAINSCTDAEKLREMAHRVAEYNGDERLAAIYTKAAELTGDSAAAAIAKELKSTVFA